MVGLFTAFITVSVKDTTKVSLLTMLSWPADAYVHECSLAWAY